MNREFKFRAFCDFKMFYSHNNITNPEYFQLHWFFGKVREDAIIMQFTGLKDKNELECYEGDIILNEDQDERIVKWCYTGFEMRLLNGNREKNNTTWYHTFEIIGNIYENTELLK